MDNLSNKFQNVISLTNIYQFLKSQTVLESSHTGLSNSHLTSSNPQGFDRDIKGFVKNIFYNHGKSNILLAIFNMP